MKKIFAILSAALLLASCNDGFLDKKPLDKLSEEDVFNSDPLAEQHVNSFYTVLPDPFQEGNIGAITDEGWFRYGGTCTRYIFDGRMTPDNVMYINEGGQAHNTRTTILNIWNRTYEFVRNMNIFIDKMNKENKLSAEVRTRLLGETYFLRAWSYYNLIARYGGVPIITKTFDVSEGEYKEQRATFDECVDFILSDIDSAYLKLPERADCSLGRINKDIALALRCRVTMLSASPLFNDPENPENNIFHGKYDQTKWERAYKAAKAIATSPNYSLSTTYDGIWKDINNPEIIWGKFFISNADGTENYAKKAQVLYSVVRYGGWTSLEPSQAMVLDYEMKNGKKVFEEGSGYDPNHPFANRDPRLYKTVAVPFSYYQNTNNEGFHGECEQGELIDASDPRLKEFFSNAGISFPKHQLQLYVYYEGKTLDDFKYSKQAKEPSFSKLGYHLWSNTSGTGYELNKWYIPTEPVVENVVGTVLYPWFRLSEMYLNLAECAYMTGREGECRDYINKVRQRPDVNMPAVTESGTNLWDRLVNERRIELAFETIRYFDVRRWKTADFWENVPVAGLYTMVLDNGGKRDTIYRMPRLYDAAQPDQDKNYYWTHNDGYNTFTYAGVGDRNGEKIDYVIEYTWLGKKYKIDYGDCYFNFTPTPKYFPKKGDIYPNYLMPIPSNEMIKSTGSLVQNPGY